MSGQVGYWLLRMEEHVADHIGHLFLTNHLDTYFCFCFLCGQKNSSADFYHNQNIYWKQDTCVCASALYIVWWCIHTEVIDAEACVHANKPCLWMTVAIFLYLLESWIQDIFLKCNFYLELTLSFFFYFILCVSDLPYGRNGK